jgi:spermidine/putrescine transport system substrate-binding protein
MPQSVLDEFAREFGIKVRYDAFQSQEEAVQGIRAGRVYDVVVLEHQLIPQLIAEGRLAELDFRNLPNFKNVGPEFRDLAIDPGNLHSVPYQFGTTGLVIRTDLVQRPLRRWADLWDPQLAGKVALRLQMRELIGITLLSLGYPFSSEDPAHLGAALRRLAELKPKAFPVPVEAEQAVAALLEGQAVVLEGWAGDYRLARERNPAATYLVPEEGTALWGDSYTIPSNSPNKRSAEIFINFLLRPAVSAQIMNEQRYANANAAAWPLVQPDLRADRTVFPTIEDLARATFYEPLSPRGQRLYEETWARFTGEGKFARE